MTNTAAAVANGHADLGSRRRGAPSPNPATASATAAGAVSSAVTSERVRNCARTISVANPVTGISAGGSRRPQTASTSSPLPAHRAASRSGKPTQAAISSIAGYDYRPRSSA